MSFEPMLLDTNLSTTDAVASETAPAIGATPSPVQLPPGKVLAFNFVFDPDAPRPTDVWEAIAATTQVIEMSGNAYADRLESLAMAEEQIEVLRKYLLAMACEGRHVYGDGEKVGQHTFEFQQLGKRYEKFMAFISFLGPFRHDLRALHEQSQLGNL